MARLPPITNKDQVLEKHHAIVDAIAQSRGAIQGPFTMFLHCPELAGRVAHLGAFVRFEGSLDMRVRVLAAMTVAREFEAVYVWGAQTGGARRQGVPESTITAIRENHSRDMPPEDAEIVDFTRQLLRNHRVDEASASSLRKRFGDEGFIELTGTVGYYSMLAITVNACELEAAPNAEVLQV
jgi:4-carboxymuconolactone decarboxylase